MSDTRGAIIEIVERRRKPDQDSPGASVVVPTDIRINGQSVMASANHPVILHEISTTDRDVVKVTVTLFARRVFIGHEDIGPEVTDLAAAQQALLDAQRNSAESVLAANERLRDAQDVFLKAQRAASRLDDSSEVTA